MIYLNGKPVEAVFCGAREVDAVYLGALLAWSLETDRWGDAERFGDVEAW